MLSGGETVNGNCSCFTSGHLSKIKGIHITLPTSLNETDLFAVPCTSVLFSHLFALSAYSFDASSFWADAVITSDQQEGNGPYSVLGFYFISSLLDYNKMTVGLETVEISLLW